MGKAGVNKFLTVVGLEEKGKKVVFTSENIVMWLYNQPEGKYKIGDKIKCPCPPCCDKI